MYGDVLNQIINLSKYSISLFFLYILLPHFVFSKKDDALTEKLYMNFLQMVAFLITLGYVLVVTKLFEIITVMAVIGFVIVFRYSRNSIYNIRELTEGIKIRIFDVFDKNNVEDYNSKTRSLINNKKSIVYKSLSSNLLFYLSFFSIIGYSAYLRFSEPTKHAAPSMSDAFSVMAWMQNICERVLFYQNGGGIYPRGFHITMAFIKKFAFIDNIYIVNYTGPLCSLMIVLGLYFAASRFTANKAAGLLAAFIYGILGVHILGQGDFERQVATNSQEFALLFAFPTIYFIFLYYRTRLNSYLFAGSSGLIITAYVHLIPYALVVMSICIVIMFLVLNGIKKNYKAILALITAGMISCVAVLIPYVLGKLLGAEIFSTSAEYLTSQVVNITFKSLSFFDILTIISLLCLLIYSLIRDKGIFVLSSEKYISIIGVATFIVYYFAPIITKNEVIETRAIHLWALVIPLGIASFYSITLAKLIEKTKFNQIFQYVLVLIVAFSTTSYGRIYEGYYMPIKPYKMVHDSIVEAHLRINESIRPTQWTTIYTGEGAYSLALGKGFNDDIKNFLGTYPNANKEEINNDKNIANNIFIFYQKKIFTTNFTNLQGFYEELEKDNKRLLEWIDNYIKNGQDLEVFYEDDNLIVYYIMKDIDKDGNTQQIWE